MIRSGLATLLRSLGRWVLIISAFVLPVMAEEHSSEIQMLRLPTIDSIERADLFFLKPPGEPKAVLILCPGKNGNGEAWLKEEKWKSFAKEHQLLLCGLWFVSEQKTPFPNYSIPSGGSGQLVLDGLAKLGAKKIPLLLYGFSAGARFSASFAENHPDRVLTWCGYSVGDWVPQKEGGQSPPGIVAAGEYDAYGYSASLQYFQAGRKQGRPWTWASARRVGHERSPELEDFVRLYFAWYLNHGPKKWGTTGEWRDIDTKKGVTMEQLRDYPMFCAWLPDEILASAWEKLHHP